MADSVGKTPTALWSGTVSFGLVSVPVDLVSATRSAATVSLRMLAPDGSPVQREYVCPADDRPLERDEIVRAYELDSGELVPLTDAELEGLAPESSRDLEIRQFVALGRISPLLFDRAYYLLPSTTALKPYRLLALTLARRDRAGIGCFVMRGHQHVAAVHSKSWAEDGLLQLETLRFAAQLRSPDVIGLPPVPSSLELDPGLVERFAATIAAGAPGAGASQTELDLAELEDPTRTQIRELAHRKLAEGRDVLATPSSDGDEAEAEVIDLMQVLAQSLARPTG